VCVTRGARDAVLKDSEVQGTEGSSGVSFQPVPFRGSSDGIFSVESLQRKFCIPKQNNLKWSPSRRVLSESREQ